MAMMKPARVPPVVEKSKQLHRKIEIEKYDFTLRHDKNHYGIF